MELELETATNESMCELVFFFSSVVSLVRICINTTLYLTSLRRRRWRWRRMARTRRTRTLALNCCRNYWMGSMHGSGTDLGRTTSLGANDTHKMVYHEESGHKICVRNRYSTLLIMFFFSAINSIASHIVVYSFGLRCSTGDTYCRRWYFHTMYVCAASWLRTVRIAIIKCKSLFRSLNPNTRRDPCIVRCVSAKHLMLRDARTCKLSLSTAYNVILWLRNFHKNLITFSVGWTAENEKLFPFHDDRDGMHDVSYLLSSLTAHSMSRHCEFCFHLSLSHFAYEHSGPDTGQS